MATYTGVADANGDFTVPFSSNYTGGQKVTVTAEKDGAEKSIELHAPSEVVGGGNIRFTGNVNNFPVNIGGVELHGFAGTIAANSFNEGSIASNATSLTINEGPEAVGDYGFGSWVNIKTLKTPQSLKSIGKWSFSYMYKLLDIADINAVLANLTQTAIPQSAFFFADKAAGHLIIPDHIKELGTQCFAASNSVTKITLGSGVIKLGTQCISFIRVAELICKPLIPPSGGGEISDIPALAIIRVPAASLSAYQSASGWSAKASQMVGF